MTGARMPLTSVHAICRALMSLTALNDSGTRSLYLEEVEGELNRPVAAPRHPEARQDLYGIVRACERENGGLEALLTVVSSFHPGASAVQTAHQLHAEWTLYRILHRQPAPAVMAAVAQATLAVTGRPLDTSGRLDQALRDVGWRAATPSGVPALLAVADLVSVHAALPSGEIESWVRSVSDALGADREELTRVRRVIALTANDHPPSPINRHQVEPPVGATEEPESALRKTTIIEESPTPVALGLIRGGIPPRNFYFTGRDQVIAGLEAALMSQRRALVLPEATLHGFGGVGKTQVAIEFAYRHADRYQLIWWISAEDPSSVRATLSALANRLGLPNSPNMELTVRSVLDELSTTRLSWLLIYDNADHPRDLEGLVPSANVVNELGHVVITSRNPAWAIDSLALQVDVFTRDESLQLLQKRRPEISSKEADRLAETLGDLPLALEQAASWLITMLSSVDEYLTEFERQSHRLMAEGQPRHYQGTVLTIVALALPRLREQAPVAALLLELLAFVGPEPISTTVLWDGRNGKLSEELRTAMQERNDIARAIRQLGSFGLATVDNANRRIQVHRLIQKVLREELITQRRDDGQRNARRLLAAANPGFPDDRDTWQRHAELAAHVRAAGLIQGDKDEQRTLLDHVRYIYNIGDFEGCRDMAAEIVDAWTRPVTEGGFDADNALTLLAIRRYADALRSLSDPRAAEYSRKALEGMRLALGDEHEYTLGAVNSAAADLRTAGEMAQAAEMDDRNLQLHRTVLGDGDPSTLRAMNSVAINRCWRGDFQGSYELNLEIERQARSILGSGAQSLVQAQQAQARDLHALGRYAESLELLNKTQAEHHTLLGPEHPILLWGSRIRAANLRKLGDVPAALAEAWEGHQAVLARFGQSHRLTASAALTYANTLRVAGNPQKAQQVARSAYDALAADLGPHHPITLCAALNLALVLRALNFDHDAHELNEQALAGLTAALPSEHPFVLCARSNQANNLVRAHKLEDAARHSSEVLEISQRIRGALHPSTLHCAVNAALDLMEHNPAAGKALLLDAVKGLERVLGPEHPDTQAARRQRRVDFDIESLLATV